MILCKYSHEERGMAHFGLPADKIVHLCLVCYIVVASVSCGEAASVLSQHLLVFGQQRFDTMTSV